MRERRQLNRAQNPTNSRDLFCGQGSSEGWREEQENGEIRESLLRKEKGDAVTAWVQAIGAEVWKVAVARAEDSDWSERRPDIVSRPMTHQGDLFAR
jgi:hypothetical protein